MKLSVVRLRRPDPVIFIISALLCAATLVVYLQHRALSAFDRQTAVILQKISEQTLTETADRIRRTFDGPVFDTLAAVNHPHLVARRIDLVAQQYERGLKAYPQVERFFAWRGVEERARADEVLFFARLSRDEAPALAEERANSARFRPDAVLGPLVLDLAKRRARSQQIYAVSTVEAAGTPYEVFLRLFYTDAARLRVFAVLGFVVNLEAARTTLFPALVAGPLRSLLQPTDGSPPFDMRVFDEGGRLVFGPEAPASRITAEQRLPLHFHPVEQIRSRLSTELPTREWMLAVSPRTRDSPALLASTRTQSYWLSALSVLLMFVALGFALQMRTRARQFGRMQAEFVAHVSHQLKTPVSLLSAVGETMALDRVRSPAKLAQCVEIVRTETARLSSLVERILEFSRVGDDARRFEIEAVPLGGLVRETAESFARAVAECGYTVRCEVTGSGPIVAADPVALEQALVNLLDNAVKYSGDSRLVTVRLTSTENEALVEVIDAGIGIEPAERDRIFERFYRGAGSAVHRQGFGLGLAISRELVASQRGSLDVQSTPGRGSTFRIRMPVLDAADAVAVQPTSAPAWFPHAWRARLRRDAPKGLA